MTWGKMDDKAHRNKKVRKLYRMGAKGREAYGVWTFRWSWCLDDPELTGFVPEDELDAGELRAAELLCSDLHDGRGLWEKVEGGYKFHDFHEYNPTKTQVENKRKYDRERKKSEPTPKGFRADSETTPSGIGAESCPTRVSHSHSHPIPIPDSPLPPSGASASAGQEVREGWAAAWFEANAGTPPVLTGQTFTAAVEFARQVAKTHGKPLHEAAKAIAAHVLKQNKTPRDIPFDLARVDPFAAKPSAPQPPRQIVFPVGLP